MIVLRGLTKSFSVGAGRRYVARNIHATFPDRTSVALLGRNGAGKSTLLKIIGGTMAPDRGSVLSTGRVSWQIGYAGSFHPDLSGAQNARFIARAYGVDTDSLLSYVNDFAELGASFQMPVRTYSSGMKARLAFGVSMGIPFSYYLIDEVTSVGDASFRAKCAEVLTDKLSRAGAIIVSHSDATLRSLCSAGAVLEKGILTYFEDIEDAIAQHNRNMGVAAEDGGSGRDPDMTPRELYLTGRQALLAGDVKRALALIESAIAGEPMIAGWHAALAAVLMRSGDLEAAVAAGQAAVRIAPLDARHHCLLGKILARAGRIDEAIASHQAAIRCDADYLPAWSALAQLAQDVADPAMLAQARGRIQQLENAAVRSRSQTS